MNTLMHWRWERKMAQSLWRRVWQYLIKIPELDPVFPVQENILQI